jgi:CheY-like chemotaxis protein
MVRGLLAPKPEGRAELVTRHSMREEHVPLDVLLVEDNSIIQLMVTRVLERAGHRVVAASDGREALNSLRSRHFDVALLDMQIPSIPGLEVARQWRAEETGARLPIIALSAGATEQERAACIEAGMDDFLSKPVDRGTLLALMERFGPRTPVSGRRVVST